MGKYRKTNTNIKPWQKAPGSKTKFNLYHESLFESEAFKSLSALAKLLYIYMVRRHGGFNETFTYKKMDSAEFMDVKSFKAKRDELVEKGFIEFAEYNRIGGIGHVYKYSAKWQQYKGDPEM